MATYSPSKSRISEKKKSHNTNTESSSAGGSLGKTPEQVELELKLLQALEIYPPKKLKGIHRNFVLYGLMNDLKRSFDRDFSSEEVLELVGRFYNLETLSDDEEIDVLNHEEDFSLPKSFFAKENKVIFAQPVLKDDNNSNDDNNKGGADNNDDQKHNNDDDDDIEDVDITNTQTKKNVNRRTISSRKFGRLKTTLPKEWIDNWKVKETSRSDGRIDKTYHHTKDEGVTFRSFIAVEEYENKKKLLGIEKEKVNTIEESSGAGGSANLKEEEEDDISKEKREEVELELMLLVAFEIYHPKKLTGIHRNFVLYGLMDYLKRCFDRDFSSEEVLELVGRFYNLEMLKDDEEIDMRNHEEDFSLPKSFFAKEKNTKKKEHQ